VLGIPDVRDPERATSRTDDPIVSRMLEVSPHASFSELLDIRVRYAPTYNQLIGHEIAYMFYLKRIPVLRHLALYFFPAHLALGWRE
jgi:hypothetical protein